jgi:hypothetical protein
MTKTPRREMDEEERERARQRAREWYAKPENRAKQAARVAERRKDPVELEKIRSMGREAARRWREENPDRRRVSVLRHRYRTKYGMTEEQIAHVMSGGLCDSCGEETATDVDHCHDRNVYRGWLCHGCNAAAGMLADDPARAEALAAYLRQTT